MVRQKESHQVWFCSKILTHKRPIQNRLICDLLTYKMGKESVNGVNLSLPGLRTCIDGNLTITYYKGTILLLNNHSDFNKLTRENLVNQETFESSDYGQYNIKDKCINCPS